MTNSTNTVSFTNISVVSPSGVLATGWEAVSADAESTDLGESIQWTSDKPLYWIPNGEPIDITLNSPVGNACQTGAYLTGNGTTTIRCFGGTNGVDPNVGTKTGTTMVEATQPSRMTVTLIGTGLEAMTFGLLVS